MSKTVLFVVALTSAALLVVHTFGGQREAIARAQAAASHLRHQRDSLVGEIDRRESLRVTLERARAKHEAVVSQLRDSVRSLERVRTQARLTVRNIRTTGALQRRMRATFPELGERGWGVSTVFLDDGDTLGLEYFLVPAWFAETFVIDRVNAELWRAQKDRLLAADSLQLRIRGLQDSVTRLVDANADAYRAGYQAAHAGYRDLSRRYVAELRKPRIDIPSPIALLGAAALGLVVGAVVR